MTAPTVATVLDVVTEKDRVAHLACGVERDQPDQPVHALCGHPLLNIDAPDDAAKCGDCLGRMTAAGGGFAYALGILRCDQHRPGGEGR